MNIKRSSVWQRGERVVTVQRITANIVYFRGENDDDCKRQHVNAFLQRYEHVMDPQPIRSEWAQS